MMPIADVWGSRESDGQGPDQVDVLDPEQALRGFGQDCGLRVGGEDLQTTLLTQRVPWSKGTLSSAINNLPVAQVHALRGQVLANRYQVELVLAAGGQGIVFGARDEKNDSQRVAIKLVKPQYAERELYFLQLLSQRLPSRFPAYMDRLEVANMAGIVMEFIEALTLRELANCGGRFSEKLASVVVLQILEIMEEVRKCNNTVMRDLKLDNILLSTEARVVLVDLVNYMNDEWPDAHSEDRPRYCAPERAFSPKSNDIRSDLYVLGVILGEILFAKRLRVFNSYLEVDRYFCRHDCLLGPSEVSGVSQNMGRILRNMLMRDIDRRYQTVEALRADLIQHLDLICEWEERRTGISL